jgi:hypothetical protein
MPRITELTAGSTVASTTDEAAVIVPVVQGGATRKLTLTQMLNFRLPKGTALDAMLALPMSGAGYPYRDGLGVWSVVPVPGAGDFDPAGTAASLVSAHDGDPGAHGGVEAALTAHVGAGGAAHANATGGTAGFMSATDKTKLDNLVLVTPVANRYTNADSPVAPTGPEILICDASGGNIVINLPAITADLDGIPVVVKARAVGANTITVNADAADDIDGAANVILTIQYQSYTLSASYDAGGNSYWSIV